MYMFYGYANLVSVVLWGTSKLTSLYIRAVILSFFVREMHCFTLHQRYITVFVVALAQRRRGLDLHTHQRYVPLVLFKCLCKMFIKFKPTTLYVARRVHFSMYKSQVPIWFYTPTWLIHFCRSVWYRSYRWQSHITSCPIIRYSI